MRLAALLLALLPTLALADVNADGFRRGVNLSHWYAQSPDGAYDDDRLATYFTADDAKLIADAGLDHVRLTLDETVLFDPAAPGTLKADALARFRGRLGAILATGLNAVVDLHPGEAYKLSLNEPANADKLVADWSALAAALADTDPSRVWLEIMNEPHGVDDWRPLQERVARGIRESAPEHAIVVSGGGWTNASTLYGEPDDVDNEPTRPFEPYEGLDNLVYTFHYYEPFMFTHQAAQWGWAPAARTKGLGWPVDPADANAVADASTSDDEARGHVRYQAEHGYFSEAWTQAKLDAVAAWRDEHDVVVYCGELGVYAKSAPRDARLAWHRFVTSQLARHDIGYAVWDYSGGFALFPGDPGERHPDEAMIDALAATPAP